MNHILNLLLDDTPKRAIQSFPGHAFSFKEIKNMAGLAEASLSLAGHSWHWPLSPSPGHLMLWPFAQGLALHLTYHM